MNAEYISYEAMVAARDAADWAFWSMLGIWGSVLFTGGALIYANRALSTWRDQEKTKVKAEFKKSILSIRNSLIFMPIKWDRDQLVMSIKIANSDSEDAGRMASKFGPDILLLSQNYKHLLETYNAANDAWVMCEHLFFGTLIEELWHSVNAGFNEYMKGGCEHAVLFEPLNNLFNQPFIFEGH